jgi:hypothetical protein
VTELHQPDRRTHPDGIHRDYHTRPIYLIPGNDKVTTKCGWSDETGRHGCNAHVPGGPFQRMTTFIGVLEDTFRLEKWGKRNVAIGFAVADHLLLKVSGEINPDDPHENKAAIDAIVEEAELAAKASAGADSGTALHKLTERLDRGERAQVPKANKPDVAAYRQLVDERKLTWDEIEVPTVLDGVQPTTTAYGIGGKFDRIAGHWLDVKDPWPCQRCGKGRRVADLKTQKDMDWGQAKTAMQLTGYATSNRYHPATGERSDLDVCQCAGYVIHLPVGKGEAHLYRADLIRARDLLNAAHKVWWARSQKGLLVPVEDAPAPDTQASTGPDIHGLISVAADRHNLVGLFQHFRAEGLWKPEHDDAVRRRLKQLAEQQEGSTT